MLHGQYKYPTYRYILRYEGGVVMNSLINYWGRTRDSQYNEIVSQALEFQKGSNNDYQPSNQSASIVSNQCVFLLHFASYRPPLEQ